MELEFHPLDVRYERLRMRQLARECRLLASLADAGQQMPIVVVSAGSAYVVVDGTNASAERSVCHRRTPHDLAMALATPSPRCLCPPTDVDFGD